jgi:Dickkopf N-terminal cysteine-rich region
MIFLLLASTSFALQACRFVICSNNTSNECATTDKTSNSIILSACNSGYECPVTSFSSFLNGTVIDLGCFEKKTSSTTPGSLTTGRPCTVSSDCVHNNCLGGICAGYVYKQVCTTDSDCISNMFCQATSTKMVCMNAYKVGVDCDFDNQCASGLGCSRGSCVQLLTLDVGKKTDLRIFCKTNYSNSDEVCDSIDVYVNGTKILSPFKCSMGDICVYKNSYSGTIQDSKNCTCDGTGANTGYCTDYVQYDATISKSMTSKITYLTSKCSGDDASTTDPTTLLLCGSINIDQYYYYKNWTYATTFWSFYISGVADSCSQSLGLYSPGWQISESIYIVITLITTILYI